LYQLTGTGTTSSGMFGMTASGMIDMTGLCMTGSGMV